MKPILALMVALVAALVITPGAHAATFAVNDNGDADSTTATCAPGAPCTLRAAIEVANATPGADTISFDTGGQAPAPAAALPAVTEQLLIDGGGDTTVTFANASTGKLLDIQAGNSVVRSIELTGGGGGTMLNLGGSGTRADTVFVHDTPATAIALTGPSERADGARVATTGGVGILVTGSDATIGSPDISGTALDGISVNGGAAKVASPTVSGVGGDGIGLRGDSGSVSGGTVHGNAGNGITITGQSNTVSGTVIYGNGGKPIGNGPAANGGITPPQNLRIGPRRADGTLPLTGNAAGGSIELWSGNPSTTTAPQRVDLFAVSGDFTYNFRTEPAPGTIFSVLLTGNGLGTAEFATVAVPSDIASPDATFARALDTTNVRVDFSEPIDPASVQGEDFKLSMAGADRQITGLSVAPDGRFVTLSSSGWNAGEAGTVELTGVGAVNDSAGNAMLTAPRLRVAAAPGDFIAPLASRLAVTKSVCLTRGAKCKKPGMVITFVTSEAGKARLVIKRSNQTVGSRLYGNVVVGRNTLKFNGRLGSRKLRAGRYRLLIYVQDGVGNVTDQPPIQLFSVRRTTK